MDEVAAKPAKLTRQEITHRYYVRHREKILAKQRLDPAGNLERYHRFVALHPERARAIKAKYAAAHRAEINRKTADRLNAIRAADPQAARDRQKALRAANPEMRRAYERAYYAADPDRLGKVHRRRARKMGNGVFVILDRDWRRMLARYRNACAYCGATGAVQQEHVIPIARGGRHSIGNILPVCGPCNRRKWAMLLVEWRHGRMFRGLGGRTSRAA